MRGTLLERQTRSASTATRHRVLLLDDSSAERAAVRTALAELSEVELVEAVSADDAAGALAAGRFDVVVSELAPDGEDLLRWLDLVRSAAPTAAVIVATSRGDEFCAAESIKRGAADYLPKQPGHPERLADCISSTIRRAEAAAVARAQGDTARYTRMLNALPVRIALLDERGIIRAVNDSWRERSFENQYQQSAWTVGADYLAICDAAVDMNLSEAESIAVGLRSVLAASRSSFTAEYATESSPQPRWFKILASGVRSDEFQGAVVVHAEISDRKWAELERDQLFEQSMSLLCIAGFDGYLRRFNPGIERLLGYSRDETMSMRLPELVHPADRVQMARMAELLRSGQRASNVEVRILAKDGSYKWILWDAVPCIDNGVFFASGQDITARKLFEQQLRESHRRFQMLASATQEAVWDWDLVANRLWQNDAYLQTFGTFDQAEETVIEWWRRRIHPADRQRIVAAIPRSAVDGQQKWVLEYRLRRLDGSYAYVYDRGYVVFDEQGKPSRMVGSLLDITELKETEQKLRESEERFRLAVKATRDAIWDWDRRSGRVWRSGGFQDLFGYPSDEVLSSFEWWSDHIHPDDRQRVLAQIPSPDDGAEQMCSFEYRFRRADGTYATVLDRGFVMFAPDGAPSRMVGSMMDISERRRAEEVTHMHQAELAHMSRVSSMGEMATSIAHELNQPLTAISNYAESCVQAMQSNAPGAEQKLLNWIEKIATNTHRAAEMIRRLRAYTRKSGPSRSTVEVGELVREVIALIEPETRLKEVRVECRTNGKVHAAVDRIQIEQVLVNLLRNAYDAMAANPAEDRRVTIAVRRNSQQVQISLEDQGEGIAPENLHAVFDAFYTSKPNGVGIGLALSRSIVEDHGGRLWVQPNPLRGVTFSFTLPLNGAQHEPNSNGVNRR